MKKYLFGVVAVVMAICTVAFTNAKKSTDTLYFLQYDNISGTYQSITVPSSNFPPTNPYCTTGHTQCDGGFLIGDLSSTTSGGFTTWSVANPANVRQIDNKN